MISSGRDSAMLRLTLARLLARQGKLPEAIQHLESAVAQDPAYTAAWKELGRLFEDAGNPASARAAWQRGVAVAQARGDKQAGKEMNVFLKRLEKKQAGMQ
ncbi:MAG TPA: tetratricopeptide repeat protein [Xanthomonadales bacterium]|nr:tetratricopeptide repeat protein [Xanthomonadales bacterium]